MPAVKNLLPTPMSAPPVNRTPAHLRSRRLTIAAFLSRLSVLGVGTITVFVLLASEVERPPGEALRSAIASTLRTVTKLGGGVEVWTHIVRAA